jgi:hypothetical protein
VINAGETIAQCFVRHGIDWNPQWLFDAGYNAADSSGVVLTAGATAVSTGPLIWNPEIVLPRVTDKPADSAAITKGDMRNRWAGEVAILALWSDAAKRVGITEADRDLKLAPTDRNTRGDRFRQAIIETLETALGPDWEIKQEVPLSEIRGMHLRQDVGGRKSDIVVVRQGMLAAIVSAKWTWRSDRGTEAAQVLFLNRYRPDVPYVLVTNEFLRALVVARESVEDAAFFLCPRWIGATVAIQTALGAKKNLRAEFPTLQDLSDQAAVTAKAMALDSLFSLTERLGRAYTII